MAEYRRAVDTARSRVYHQLRRYVADRDQLNELAAALHSAVADRRAAEIEELRRAILVAHSSTREREPYYDLFYRELFATVGPVRTVLDLGSGVHPLSFPFGSAATRTELYVAVDRDPAAAAAIRAFADHVRPCRLVVMQRDLSEAWWGDVARESPDFDLVLMLKVVPVLARQDRSALSGIVQARGRRWLVTGSAEALTRRASIRDREDASLRRFIATVGLPVISRLDLPNEIGYVLGAGGSSS